MIVVQRQTSFSCAGYLVSATGLLLLIFLPVAVVVRQEYRAAKNELEEPLLTLPPTTVTVVDKATALAMEGQGPANTPAPLPSSASPSHRSWLVRTFSPPAHGEEYSILQALARGEGARLCRAGPLRRATSPEDGHTQRMEAAAFGARHSATTSGERG